ncbi:MAG: cobalt-precorrin-5B (C(1))-methyltransferase CbiD [Synergistaceae bacterium]|jgi:cobalt-precorrin-5B (C1)-methyltransferase|nr:cobalt-precorrin-5B (C(1))-methyltransferase CbiD [Synergistaceae bacterium]
MSLTKGVGMMSGFTTGSAAAAAAVSAARFLFDRNCGAVTLNLPGGRDIVIPITGCRRTEDGAEAWVTKDAGDDPDITHGAVIVADVKPSDESGITILGGLGVGVVTKPGLLVPPGKAAINPGPMALIRKSLGLELPQGMGARVTISIPGGEELAKQTYNPRLGIIGGLSILGTTGIVSPMSSDAIIGTIKTELSVLKASGANIVCLVPGNYGRRMAILIGIPEKMIVNISNFVGESLAMVGNSGFEKLIMIGQVGKFAKLSAGSLDTHSMRSDGRLEAIAAYSALHGATSDDVREILDSSMADEMATRIARTEWGNAALRELVDRIVKTALTAATGISDGACLTFSLPDRELARTDNLDELIAEIKKNAESTQ